MNSEFRIQNYVQARAEMSALVFAERMGRVLRGIWVFRGKWSFRKGLRKRGEGCYRMGLWREMRAPDGKGYTKGIPRVYKNNRYIGCTTQHLKTEEILKLYLTRRASSGW